MIWPGVVVSFPTYGEIERRTPHSGHRSSGDADTDSEGHSGHIYKPDV
jgi:hypothetical protein